MDSWSVLKLIEWAEPFLRAKGVDSPRLDVELLLAKVLGLSRVQLYVQFDRPLAESELAAFKALLKRRAAREPLAYILGEREFYSLKFKVGPEVLVPRPETEELVERGLAHLKAGVAQGLAPRVLDLASGSGCILLALLKNCPEASGLGADISAAALGLARENAKALQVEARTEWVELDLSRDFAAAAGGPWDLITANLPYVSAADWEGLQDEIRQYEPRAALTPGPAGTEAFDWVFPRLPGLLKPGGLILLEIGADQGAWLSERAAACLPGWQVGVERDLAGLDRILSLAPAPSHG